MRYPEFITTSVDSGKLQIWQVSYIGLFQLKAWFSLQLRPLFERLQYLYLYIFVVTCIISASSHDCHLYTVPCVFYLYLQRIWRVLLHCFDMWNGAILSNPNRIYLDQTALLETGDHGDVILRHWHKVSSALASLLTKGWIREAAKDE